MARIVPGLCFRCPRLLEHLVDKETRFLVVWHGRRRACRTMLLRSHLLYCLLRCLPTNISLNLTRQVQ